MRKSAERTIGDQPDLSSGSETSLALKENMVRYILRAMAAHSPTGENIGINPTGIDRAIKAAFLNLDRDILDLASDAAASAPSLRVAMSLLGPAYAGSCALVSFYQSESQLLKTACTGDCRAVLGRFNASGGLDTIPLTTDQTGRNPDEIARLRREHPHEPEMVKNGRVLGLAVSRSFGDCRFKWSRELQEQARDRFYGPSIIEPMISPPYITAEPVVTTTKIEPEKGDFLILASDVGCFSLYLSSTIGQDLFLILLIV